MGRDSGEASSVTRAGITGIAGDTSLRTGDASSGIAPIFDAQRVQSEVDAQTTITQLAGPQAAQAWGDFATRQYLEALEGGDEEGQSCWGADGTCRAAGHAVVGALTGGLAGAAGAAASSMAIPNVQQTLIEAGLPIEVANVAAQVLAVGTGAALGGAPAGAAALNETGNNALVFAPLLFEGLVAAGAGAARACVANPACISRIATLGVTAVAAIQRLANPEGAELQTGAPGFLADRPAGTGGGTSTLIPTARPVVVTTSPQQDDPSRSAVDPGFRITDRLVDGTTALPITQVEPEAGLVVSTAANSGNAAAAQAERLSGRTHVATGLAPVETTAALTGMRNDGGHAIRHLEGVLIPTTGSLQSRVEAFRSIAAPILENPSHVAPWRIGDTQGQAFLGAVSGNNVVIVVAREGPYMGRVVSAFIPDENQLTIIRSR